MSKIALAKMVKEKGVQAQGRDRQNYGSVKATVHLENGKSYSVTGR